MKSTKGILLFIVMLVLSMALIVGCGDNGDEPVESEDQEQAADQENDEQEDEAAEEDAQEEEEAVYPKTVVDSYDREVVLESRPETLVSIAPSITEIIFALERGDLLIGRTDFCDYPAEVSEVESIGSLMEPNIEKIVELDPDVVIASTHFSRESLEKMEELGLTVLVFYGSEDFEGTFYTIEVIGELFEEEEKASEIVSDMKETIADVKERVEGLEKPSVYYVIGFGEWGDYTATGETFISEMIEIAGGENIAKEAEGWQYSVEKIVEQDPEILIVSKFHDSKAGIMEATGYKELTAVQEDRIFEIDNNLLDRTGPRMAEGLRTLAEIFHPEAFE